MIVTFVTRNATSHRIRLGMADYQLFHLQGFRELSLLPMFLFGRECRQWVRAEWFHSWMHRFDFTLRTEQEVLPYRYGANGDFGGGQTVMIDGEQWVLHVGAGECSLSQERPFRDGIENGSRLMKWIDLRGQPSFQVDDGVIKLSRKKQEFRWYNEMPGLLRFLEGLPVNEEVAAWAAQGPLSIGELLRIADEEPGGVDVVVEMLSQQREKWITKMRQALEAPSHRSRRELIQLVLSMLKELGE